MSNHQHQVMPIGHYVNTWITILLLFAVSITVAQISSNRPLVLVVAFGIAIVQALLVAAYFMHLKGEQKYIHYLLYSMLIALAMLYMGTVTDNGKPSGQHWNATDSEKIIQEHSEHHPSQEAVH